jgi:ubiquitin-conjugating enzyme E2 J1
LGECEERVREMGEKAAAERKEVEVPKELKMGWRDEMEAAQQKKRQTEEGDGDGESDGLAEGFVQTVPVSSSSSGEPSSGGAAVAGGSAAPPPTRTMPSPSPLPVAAGPALQQVQRVQQVAADETAVWLDRLIVAVAVLLAAVVAKVMLA